MSNANQPALFGHAPDVRALTVKQPWAWAILHGGKNVENRTWKPAGRDPFRLLIHAGKGVDAVDVGAPPALPAGVIFAVVTVESWHHARDCGGTCSPWAEPDGYHWMLTDPHDTPLLPTRGRLQMWRPEPGVVELLGRAGVI